MPTTRRRRRRALCASWPVRETGTPARSPLPPLPPQPPLRPRSECRRETVGRSCCSWCESEADCAAWAAADWGAVWNLTALTEQPLGCIWPSWTACSQGCNQISIVCLILIWITNKNNVTTAWLLENNKILYGKEINSYSFFSKDTIVRIYFWILFCKNVSTFQYITSKSLGWRECCCIKLFWSR